MEDFQENENVCQIKHCRHTFKEEAIKNWFQRNVRCPVCRYDIRDYFEEQIVDISNNVNTPVRINRPRTVPRTTVRTSTSTNIPIQTDVSNNPTTNPRSRQTNMNNFVSNISNGLNNIIHNYFDNDLQLNLNNNLDGVTGIYTFEIPLPYYDVSYVVDFSSTVD